jgi:hypothetical protein
MAVAPIRARLRRIQQKLGIHADGLLGPETLTALEHRLEITPAGSHFNLEVSRRSLALLVQFEVSSKAHYVGRLRRPTWPGETSGVTIGIGYDLGMTPTPQILSDWRHQLSDIAVARLATAQGITGEPAAVLARSLSDIEVSFEAAEAVFYRCTLPRFAKLTRTTFPRCQTLPPDAQGMLLSLVYNRGAALSGPRRREMAELRAHLAGRTPDLVVIAGLFEAMTRLWPVGSGLVSRRRREAALIRGAARSYGAAELIRL